MLQWNDIQTLARHHTRVSDLDIVSGAELVISNFVYRRFVALLPWEDFTRIYTALTTTAGDGTVNWPGNPNFQDLLSLEIQDGDDADKYKRVPPSRSIQQWLALESKPNGMPEQYRIYRDMDTEVSTLELRPKPKWSNKTIRFDGVIEPEEFESGIERTGFRLRGIDDALALARAAVHMAKIGQQPRSQQLLQWSADTIRLNTGKEISPDEIREKLLL